MEATSGSLLWYSAAKFNRYKTSKFAFTSFNATKITTINFEHRLWSFCTSCLAKFRGELQAERVGSSIFSQLGDFAVKMGDRPQFRDGDIQLSY